MLMGLGFRVSFPEHYDYPFDPAKFPGPILYGRHAGGGASIRFPPVPQVPDCEADQVAEGDAAGVSLRRLDLSPLKEGEVFGYYFGQCGGGFYEPTAWKAAGGAAHKDGVDDGGGGAVDVNRGAHLGGTRKRSGADQTSIEQGDGDREIGVELIVVVGEG